MLWLVALGWLLCAVLAYGMYVAYYQREWPRLAQRYWREDAWSGLILALPFGPVFLVAAFLGCGFAKHGLMFWPPRHFKQQP